MKTTTKKPRAKITIEQVKDCKLVYERTEDNGHDCWGNLEWYTVKCIRVNGKEERAFDDWWVKHNGTEILGYSYSKDNLKPKPRVKKIKQPTAKDKATELITQFYPHVIYSVAKECALITVNQILKVIPMYTGNLNPTWQYWQDIKKEIENLNT